MTLSGVKKGKSLYMVARQSLAFSETSYKVREPSVTIRAHVTRMVGSFLHGLEGAYLLSSSNWLMNGFYNANQQRIPKVRRLRLSYDRLRNVYPATNALTTSVGTIHTILRKET